MPRQHKKSVVKVREQTSRDLESTFRLLTLLIVILSLYNCFRVVGGYHSYRQAQTNFPIKNWITKGFSPMRIEIPFIGDYSNWLFEFPLFQWIAYFVTFSTHLNVDYVVRILSFIFAFGSLLTLLGFKENFSDKWKILFVTIFSPFFLYWSTTGLVDWFCIFLGILGIRCFHWLQNPRRSVNVLYKGVPVVLLLASALIKLPLFLFAVTLSLLVWHYFDSRTIENSRNKTEIAIVVTFSVLCALAWLNWLKSLYPDSDPRSLWVPRSETFGWYFGTQDQYLNSLNNLYVILSGYFSSSNLAPVVVLLMFFFLPKRSKKYLAFSVALSIGYLVVFINLNIVHAYYQIPLIYSGIFALILFSDCIQKIKYAYPRLPQTVAGIVLISMIVSLSSQTGRGYLNQTFTREPDVQVCLGKQVNNVFTYNLSIGPALYYECKVEGFNVYSISEPQIKGFLKVKREYTYAYIENSTNYYELKEFLTKNGGEIDKYLNANWLLISWKD